MYGKIFTTIYDSTLMTNQGWIGVYVFSSMVVLCDENGVVNMTPDALYRRIGLTEEACSFNDFLKTIKELEAPDEHSNIKDSDGRRIIPLSELEDIDLNRGWLIVSHQYYRDKGSKRKYNEYQRGYMAAVRKLAAKDKLEKVRSCENQLGELDHSDTDSDTDSDTENKKGKTIKGRDYKRLSLSFKEFMKAYPTSTSSQPAKREWMELRPNQDMVSEIIASVEAHKRTEQWQEKIIPSPYKFLKEERYKDEIKSEEPF